MSDMKINFHSGIKNRAPPISQGEECRDQCQVRVWLLKSGETEDRF